MINGHSNTDYGAAEADAAKKGASRRHEAPDCCQVGQVFGRCPAGYQSTSGSVCGKSVCCKDPSHTGDINCGMPTCGHRENQVSGASSEDIDKWLDETHHKYEHSDDAYSVQVMGALVALALVVAV